MLPNEAANVRILWNGLIRAIWALVVRGDGFDQKMIYKGISVMGDLILKDERHVSLVNLYGVGVTHWYSGEMMRAHGTVEGGKVL